MEKLHGTMSTIGMELLDSPTVVLPRSKVASDDISPDLGSFIQMPCFLESQNESAPLLIIFKLWMHVFFLQPYYEPLNSREYVLFSSMSSTQ